MTRNPIRPALFRFLEELDAHNERPWFLENKTRYEADVQAPVLAFIEAVGPALRKASPHLVVGTRKVGGSMTRIQRDTRFARDKTPYKDHVALRFHHEAARAGASAPGFYMHLSPGGSAFAMGLWRPTAASARQVRASIVENAAAWKRLVHGKRFGERFELEGEMLKRPPRGFDPDHPLLEDLQRKDFVAVAKLGRRDVVDAEFPKSVGALVRAGTPFVRFLCTALELPF